jgi:hypothetical protein
MKKIICIAVLGIIVSAYGDLHAEHIPTPGRGAMEFQSRTALLMHLENANPVLELQGWFQGSPYQFRYRSVTAGGYYRIHRNLKVGAFYRWQQGARHDDDWIDLNPGWAWVDSRSRSEHLFIADVSPRFQLRFLPGENWVLMLKARYRYNSFNSQHALILRPGLTYYLLLNREPLLNFSINYGLYFPLNFGSTLIYEHSPYINVLYHVSPTVKLELNGTFRSVVWSSSQDAVDDAFSYEVTDRTFLVGLGVLFSYTR